MRNRNLGSAGILRGIPAGTWFVASGDGVGEVRLRRGDLGWGRVRDRVERVGVPAGRHPGGRRLGGRDARDSAPGTRARRWRSRRAAGGSGRCCRARSTTSSPTCPSGRRRGPDRRAAGRGPRGRAGRPVLRRPRAVPAGAGRRSAGRAVGAAARPRPGLPGDPPRRRPGGRHRDVRSGDDRRRGRGRGAAVRPRRERHAGRAGRGDHGPVARAEAGDRRRGRDRRRARSRGRPARLAHPGDHRGRRRDRGDRRARRLWTRWW